jgi:hypothetical protein
VNFICCPSGTPDRPARGATPTSTTPLPAFGGDWLINGKDPLPNLAKLGRGGQGK